MAAHVVADAHFGFRRRGKMEMRIEARDAVQLIERSLRAFGKGLEFRLWQIPEAELYGSQFVEDHGLGLVKCADAYGHRRISWNCYPAY